MPLNELFQVPKTVLQYEERAKCMMMPFFSFINVKMVMPYDFYIIGGYHYTAPYYKNHKTSL